MRGLLVKFLWVMVPLFLALSVPGIGALVDHQRRDTEEALAARIGNQAARVAAAFGRHRATANPSLAQDLLEPLAADRAFLCAEVRSRATGRRLAAAPRQQGCSKLSESQTAEMRLSLPIGDDGAATLIVRFTSLEVVKANAQHRSLWLSVVGLSFLIAILAAAIGFRIIVGRPLGQLLNAIRHATETGERKPVEKAPKDELGRVIVAFNELLHRETEREDSLTQQRSVFESIFRGVPDALVLTDAERRIIVANPGVKTVFGYDPEEVKGKLTATFFANQEEFERLGKQRFNKKSPDMVPSIEARFRRKSGEEFPVEVVGASIRDQDGAVVGFIGLMRDISERKKVEAALAEAHSHLEIQVKERTAELRRTNRRLREEIKERKTIEMRLRQTEEHYALAMQSTSEVFWEWTAETGRLSRHPVAWKKFGLADRPYETTVEEWIDVIHPDDVEHYQANFNSYMRGETEVYVSEYRVRRTDGGYRWIHERGLGLRNENGDVYRMGGSFADVTRRKRTERDLQTQTELNQSMEEFHQVQKHESLGTLAGGIAHDFNNILNIMMGFAHLIVGDLPSGSPHRPALLEILKSGERGAALVEQILTYAQKAERRRDHVQLDALLEDGVGMIRAALPSSARIESDCQIGVAPVLADETQLLQIITNLCVNAAHALGGAPGQIDVSCREISVNRGRPTRLRQLLEANGSDAMNIEKRKKGLGGRLWFGQMSSGRHVRFAVEDNGCGMDWATLSRIFEPFFTTKPVGEGTGLGLAAVTGIVRDHGGAIMIDTMRDKGTRFEVYLPAAEAKRPADDVADAKLAGVESILMVGGSAKLLRSMAEQLTELGYDVTTRADGAAGLKVFESKPDAWDLIVADQVMAKLAGMEFARHVRATRADLPIVMRCGLVNSQLKAEAKAAGVSEIHVEPLTGAALAGIARGIFDRPHKPDRNVA